MTADPAEALQERALRWFEDAAVVEVERAQASALTIARWLEANPAVARVRYIGLPSHPQHDAFVGPFHGASLQDSVEERSFLTSVLRTIPE